MSRDLDRSREGGTPERGAGGGGGKATVAQRLVARRIILRAESDAAARELGGGARDANGVAASADGAVAGASSSSGAPLPADVQAKFETSLGADLSAVRVHTGGESQAAAGALGARAYTTGNDIHFAGGQYAPSDPFGLHLLAHEVAHTVQQAGGAATTQYKLEVSSPGDAAELEADHAADAMVGGARATIAGHAPCAMRAPAVPAVPKASVVGAASWLDVIPDAVAGPGHKAQTSSGGIHDANGNLTDFHDGTLSYHQAGSGAAAHDVATAGPLAGSTTTIDVTSAVTAIATARAAIHGRALTYQKGKYAEGYQYLSGTDAARTTGDADEIKAAKDYRTWLKTALPTSVTSPSDPYWQIYNTVKDWEGDTSAMNSYDSVNVTWGSGFSAAGSVQELILRVFDKSPEIRALFFGAGLTIDGKRQFCVVDTAREWKLHGMDAELYVRTDTQLQSLMINCAQGAFEAAPKSATATDPRQAVLDANFETFMNGAMSGIPSDVLGWPVPEAALACHSRHMSLYVYPWSAYAGLSPHTTADIAQVIYDRAYDWFSKGETPDDAGMNYLKAIAGQSSPLLTVVKRRPNPTPTPKKAAPKLFRDAAPTPTKKGGPSYTPAKRAQMQWPDGIMMSFYAKFDPPGADADDDAKAEFNKNSYFMNLAILDAKAMMAVKAGPSGISLGVATPIQSYQTIVDTIAATTAALKKAYEDEGLVDANGATDHVATADAWKVKLLNIYSHGDVNWLGTGGSTNGNLTPSSLPGFVKSVAPNLKSDVQVALFACATGSNSPINAKGKPDNAAKDAADKGKGSFADSIQHELAKYLAGAGVMGHTSYAAASENPNIRYFSGGAGGGDGVVDRIWPPATVASMFATRPLGATSAADYQAKLAGWFAGYMMKWHLEKEGNYAGKQVVQIGTALSLAPDVAIPVVRDAFAAAKSWGDYSYAPRIDLYQLGRVEHVIGLLGKAKTAADFDAVVRALSACNMADLLNLLEDVQRGGFLATLRSHVDATWYGRILVAMDAVAGVLTAVPPTIDAGEADTIRSFMKGKATAGPGTAPLADCGAAP